MASQGEEAVQVRAKCCLVTCSIGVLQLEADEGGIEFSPYPETLRTHLSGLAMGNVVKVVLRFSRRIWPAHPNAADATFLHVPDALFATYWRQSIGKHEQVTAWAGGPPSLELSRLGAEQVAEHALGCFARLVGEDPALVRAALIEAHHHDFIGDPFSCGAYSYVRPGGEQAARALSQPLQDTLFFAGEALDLEFPATVAGALGSGQHAARKILTVLAPRQIQSGAAPVMGK